MAKTYEAEMSELGRTFAWAVSTDIETLRQAVRTAGLSPLLAVGSGGSLVTARALADLHKRSTSQFAAVATPLEAIAVFEEVGGSLLVLSPVGSKIMALGALMAALERDLPVAYLESIGYEMDPSVSSQAANENLMHIWLEGDVYPQPRPSLRTLGGAVR